MTTLQRQWITDTTGPLMGIILPVEEYELVANLLQPRAPQVERDLEEQLKLLEQAPEDKRFMNDLRETMSAFAYIDAQW